VPDHDLTYVDLIRGEVTFPAGSFPDFVVVRAGGQALYTFTNPVDDALMGITHVIRGEDLMPSTARQLALYAALIDAGVTDFVPRFGHMPLVLGETGNKKLSKRDPQADLFCCARSGFIHEGLLNYLALLGWSIAADRDVFSRDEFVAAFDIVDVNPNPPASTRRRPSRSTATTSACSRRGLRGAARSLSRRRRCRRESTDGAAAGDTGCRRALVQERMQLLGDAPGLLGFLFRRGLLRRRCRRGSARERGRGARGIRGRSSSCPSTASPLRPCRKRCGALIDGLGLKPRVAYGPCASP
jgi:glutamyl-tRNA synthetase